MLDWFLNFSLRWADRRMSWAISVWRSQEAWRWRLCTGSVPQEQPELSPPPAMKSNQEAEQSPMDLTSLFNYSAVSQQQPASLSLSTLQEKDMLQYDSNTEKSQLLKMKHVPTEW